MKVPPAYEKAYELILWLFPTVNKFPKNQRFVLGQQIENTAVKIMEDIIWAMQAKSDKHKFIKRASTRLDVLRITIRISKDLQMMDHKQYRFCATKMNELGKMLGGWMKVA